ncbi:MULTISPECIES: hypothetical protein [Halomonas]|uniref:hypothetical protein n=1 Tax=Halomonas TaxID=2745 RepID=UPI000A2840DB|nr:MULTISPECIES: hypothetical protein [Halomonas]
MNFKVKQRNNMSDVVIAFLKNKIEIEDMDVKSSITVIKFLLNKEHMEMEVCSQDDTYNFKYAKGGCLDKLLDEDIDKDNVSLLLYLAVMDKASSKIEDLMLEAIESVEEVQV